MKQLLTLLLTSSVFAAFAADIQVNNSGQPGTYNTIQLAINNAVDGDRIVISPYNLYTENVVIAKSLTFICSVQGNRFVVNGDLSLTGAPNREIIIIGAEIKDVFVNAGTSIDYTFKVSIVDSKMLNFSATEYVLSDILYCNFNGALDFVKGKIISNYSDDLNLNITMLDALNTETDTNFIIANRCHSLTIDSDDFFIFAANNLIYSVSNSRGLEINKSKSDPIVNHNFDNNSIYAYGSSSSLAAIWIDPTVNASNIRFHNNCILTSSGINPYEYGGPAGQQPSFYYNISKYYIDPTSVNMVVGNLINSSLNFNGGPGGDGHANGIASNDGAIGVKYMNLNLTRNTRGTYGGPYSYQNYPKSGYVNRIYNLEMPFEIWNGSTPTIKADGTSMK